MRKGNGSEPDFLPLGSVIQISLKNTTFTISFVSPLIFLDYNISRV
jgi:hypothetical protein